MSEQSLGNRNITLGLWRYLPKAIKSYFKRLFAKVADLETIRRIYLLYLLSIIGIIFIFLFGLLGLLQGNVLLGIFDFTLTVILIVNLLHAHKYRNYKLNVWIGIMCTGVLYIYLFLSGGVDNSAVVWYFTFPIIACYLLGSGKGMLISLVMLIPVISNLFIQFKPDFAVYQTNFLIRFIFAYLVILLFSFLFEFSRERMRNDLTTINAELENRVLERTWELREKNQKLKKAIEKKVRVESALKKSESSLAEAQKIARIGSWEWEIKTGKIIWSDQMYSLLKVKKTKKKPPATHFYKYCHPKDLPDLKKVIQQLKKVEGSAHLTHRVIQEGGTEITVHEHIASIPDKSGIPCTIMGTTQDITELKESERKQKELETRLRHVHRLRAMGTLASGIAHDFNNILASIMGYLDLSVNLAEKDSKLSKYLNRALKGADRAKDLIEQITIFGRRNEQRQKPIELHPLVKEATKLLKATLPSTIKIVEDIDSKAGVILADSTQIHQVVVNLCTNSYQAMMETGGKLVISLKQYSVSEPEETEGVQIIPGKYAVLAVKDSGHGMDEETLSKIFEPYFTTKVKQNGTGLGLSVVHGIVKNHDGFITVKSKVSKGTCFKIYFPCIDSILREVEKLSEMKPDTGEEKILLVDDDDMVLDPINLMVKSLGYQVTRYKSSKKALTSFLKEPHRYDCVISDMTMPEFTGIDLAKTMLNLRPDLPFLLLTGGSKNIDMKMVKSVGINTVLLKPVKRDELAKAIRRLFASPV